MAQKAAKRNGRLRFGKNGQKYAIKGKAEKKTQLDVPKKERAGGRTDDDPLTYARIPVNIRKVDYETLVDYEKENGIFNHASVVRQFVLEKLKAWKESKTKKLYG